jgi:outer membrane protein
MVCNSAFLTKQSFCQMVHSQQIFCFIMKNASLVLNAVLLVAVIVLYVLFFNEKKAMITTPGKVVTTTAPGGGARIAYFDMDSLERGYNKIVDVRTKLKNQEQNIGDELSALKKTYMSRVSALQQKAQNMSQQEGEAAQAEINQMQQSLQQKEAVLTQNYQDEQYKTMQDINKTIESFLKTYNQQKGYSFIFSHQPGDFIYYKDSAHNITADLINGLNAAYTKPK